MKQHLSRIARVAATLLIAGAGAAAAVSLWHHYRDEPWTRDGRVRTEIVLVAPDVSGVVERLQVKDNQLVHRNDVLFVIDQERYKLALAQAEATLNGIRAQIAQAKREEKRNVDLGSLVPQELREQGDSKVEQLSASLAQALAARDAARLNLARTVVRASVDGWVTNLDLRPGAYATAGKSALALVDQHSLHVLGYFEETKVGRIHVGAPVRVRLMGDTQILRGHVESIAAGIEDRERTPSSNLLANVNPTFNWVRLAQRIPVRVELDGVPADSRLIMGRTATVEVLEQPAGASVALGGR